MHENEEIKKRLRTDFADGGREGRSSSKGFMYRVKEAGVAGQLISNFFDDGPRTCRRSLCHDTGNNDRFESIAQRRRDHREEGKLGRAKGQESAILPTEIIPKWKLNNETLQIFDRATDSPNSSPPVARLVPPIAITHAFARVSAARELHQSERDAKIYFQ